MATDPCIFLLFSERLKKNMLLLKQAQSESSKGKRESLRFPFFVFSHNLFYIIVYSFDPVKIAQIINGISAGFIANAAAS